jgi:hypothetical protein
MSSTPPAKIKITPRAIQRQEPATVGVPARPPPVSTGVCVCSGLEGEDSGTLVACGNTPALTVGVNVGDSGAVVDSTVVDFVASGAVWLPAMGEGVGEKADGAVVTVAAPKVGSPVRARVGTELVAVGVSDGTGGGSVGALVGGGATGLVEVGVLVAPVGVAVGMV